jgi:hypothetical protein
MALRRTNSTSETAPTTIGYYIEVVTKTPFESISNQPFCVWQYRIRVLLATQPSTNYLEGVRDQKILTSDAPPHTISVKVGLEFSSRIDIKLPALYPECQPVQGTSVSRATTGTSQYVWQQLQVQRTAPDHIDLFFIAPCEEDLFTPVHLVFSPSEGAAWIDFPFQVTGQANPCRTQVIRGPAIVVPMPCIQPAPAGTQPAPAGTQPAPAGTQPAPAGTQPASPTPSPASAVELTNSKRILYSASHLSTKLTDAELSAMDGQAGGAMRKVNLLRALSLDQDSHARLSEQIGQLAPAVQEPMKQLLAASSQLVSEPGTHLQIAKAVAALPQSAVLSFAQLASETAPAQSYLHVMTDIYAAQTKISPVGRLYLERLEMFPAGVERGELVFTVPMAPGESTTISHKEWSTSSRGYEDVVQDFFENYSERGVTEKTDSSSAAEREVNRSNSLNFGATLTGSYGPVSLTTNLGLMTAGSERQSIKTSMQRSQEITEKSSARVRQEHKVSIKIESKQGMDSTSYKTITNPSPDAVRIDYYKMMRKWRTDLYRYGLRLTYDICIPTPGVRLWARWRRVAEIDAMLAAPLPFGWKPEDIKEDWVHPEALKLGILVDDPPTSTINPPSVFDTTPYQSEGDAGAVQFGRIEFDVPPGYQLASAIFTADLAVWTHLPNWLNVLNADFTRGGDRVTSLLPLFIGNTGHQSVSYAYRGVSRAALRVEFTCIRQAATYVAWQKAVWHQLHDAAAARYQEQNARLQGERDILWRALVGKDTLSLRRLEREEMLRLIMLWILGPDALYANAPAWIESTVNLMLRDEIAFLQNKGAPATPSPSFGGIDGMKWSQALIFGDFVKFVQQAIEWENLLYFLYPYFWGSEEQGREKMLFEHPDPEHQNFLRAGYCRVVITVRPGFEEDFTRLVEIGSLKEVDSPGNLYTSPYLPIAEEIANRALTNYAGIPPANPEKHARPLLYPQQRQTWATMELVIAAIEKFKLDNGEYPATLAALPAGLKTDDAWGRPLVYANPGSGNDYDLISLGSNGTVGGDDTAADISSAAGASLMATWYDYTPTSGIDIVVNTSPSLIA